MKILLILGLLARFAIGESFRDEVMSHKNWRLIDRNQCGMVKTIPRITKGQIAKISKFPWMVQVLQRVPGDNNRIVDKFVCSGTLINKQYVVTAAHCVAGNERITKFIRLGESVNVAVTCAQSLDDCSSRRVKIEDIVIHEEYNKSTNENDIALIRLDEEVEFKTNVMSLCLPADDVLENSFLGEKVEVAGWGQDSSETASQMLKYVTLPIRDRCVCEGTHNKTIDEKQLCIGVETGEDTCNGDSGGPVVWKRNDYVNIKHYFIGLTSFGDEECGEGPAIYTNVKYFVTWILDNMYGSEYDLIVDYNKSGHTTPETKPEEKPKPPFVILTSITEVSPETIVIREHENFISDGDYSESDSDSEEYPEFI